MSASILWEMLIAIVGGMTIELFFQLVKYRDSLNSKYPAPVTSYDQLVDANNYMSVSQYLSNGRRKWVNYFIFRLVPPFIIFLLLGAIYDKYFDLQQCILYILLAALVSLFLRDILLVFKAKLISERLLHFSNIIMVLLISYVVGYMAQYIQMGIIAPNVGGLIDNLWSSLIVAMLVIIYIKSTNMSGRGRDQYVQDTTISNYVVSSFDKISANYSAAINDACDQFNCSKAILYSVLIYENMNRPSWFRKIENIIVRLFRFKLTLGLAQIRSSVPLSDEESIRKAAEILGGSDSLGVNITIDDFREIITKYNTAENYTNSVFIIIEKLKIYESGLFNKSGRILHAKTAYY